MYFSRKIQSTPPPPTKAQRARARLLHALIYFADNTGRPGKTKLFKLLYMLDFEAYRTLGKSVTGLDYYAWDKGPIATDLWGEWDQPSEDFQAAIGIEMVPTTMPRPRAEARALIPFDEKLFTRRELELMRRIADTHRTTDGPTLSDLSHVEGGAWARVWKNGSGKNQQIPYDYALIGADPNFIEALREYEAYVAASG